MFKIGDRVFYNETGECDTGTVVDIDDTELDQFIVVKWDTASDDEKVDGFAPSQITLCE